MLRLLSALKMVRMIGLLLLAAAEGHYHTEPYDTDALIEQLRVGHHMEVDGVPTDFECAWRTAAMAHAKELQPFLSTAQQRSLFDALELGVGGDDHKGHAHGPCKKAGGSPSFESLSWEPQLEAPSPRPAGELELHPATAEELLAAVDSAAGHDGPTLINLAPGTVYRLNATLVLGKEHSHTTFSSKTLPGGAATISGSKLLEGLHWAPVAVKNVSKGVYKATVSGVAKMDALRVNGQRATRARYPNANVSNLYLPHLSHLPRRLTLTLH